MCFTYICEVTDLSVIKYKIWPASYAVFLNGCTAKNSKHHNFVSFCQRIFVHISFLNTWVFLQLFSIHFVITKLNKKFLSTPWINKKKSKDFIQKIKEIFDFFFFFAPNLTNILIIFLPFFIVGHLWDKKL